MRTAIGLVMILTVVIVVIVVLVRRRDRDEIHSIDHYRDALTTLDDMRAPSGRTIRILSEDEARELRQPHPAPLIRSEPPRSPTRLEPPNGPGEPITFDDAGEPIELSDDPHRSHLHHDNPQWAIERMDNRHVLHNRELLAAGGALAVLAVLIVVGVAIGGSSGSSKHVATTTSQATTTTGPGRTTTTTTTALPTTFQPQPGATATAATYFVSGGSFTAVIQATGGPCWTIATGVDGSSLFTGSIPAGSSQTITKTGGFSVSLGAPGNVTVTMNGIPVAFPPSYGAPLVLSFISPPSSTTTTAPSSPTTTAAP